MKPQPMFIQLPTDESVATNFPQQLISLSLFNQSLFALERSYVLNKRQSQADITLSSLD
jgi:hypothetical protein